MTEFYGLPNSGAFWHWPTLIHFVLVALAGGTALVTALLTFRRDKSALRYAWVALVLIVLDLLVLWAESSARFRFTHLWLFVTFKPTAAMWWGAWGLAGSALMTFLLGLGWGPKRLWASGLSVTSTLVLLYPGLLLVANAARPLWTPVLLAFIPLTSLLTVLGLGMLLRWAWAKPWLLALSIGSALLGGLYLVGLAVGGLEAKEALAHFWHEGGPLYLLGLVLMLMSPALLGRFPMLAGLSAVAGATLARSLIVEIGQLQGFGL